MTIEVTILLSVMSLSFAIYAGLRNIKRSEANDVKSDTKEVKEETKQDTAALTTVIVKLEHISTGIAEIKAEVQTIRLDQKEDHDKLIETIGETKRAHERIDELIKRCLVHEKA